VAFPFSGLDHIDYLLWGFVKDKVYTFAYVCDLEQPEGLNTKYHSTNLKKHCNKISDKNRYSLHKGGKIPCVLKFHKL